MGDNVTSIFGGPVSGPDGDEPSEAIIELLKELLAMAEDGRLQNLAVTYLIGDHSNPQVGRSWITDDFSTMSILHMGMASTLHEMQAVALAAGRYDDLEE